MRMGFNFFSLVAGLSGISYRDKLIQERGSGPKVLAEEIIDICHGTCVWI